MKTQATILSALMAVLFAASGVFAHCEIPCGIYGDQMRIDQIAEHITTVEKSMKTIEGAHPKTATDRQQLIRWVINKDEHATKIQEIVWQYFMTQRIKPVDPQDAVATAKYVHELTLLHKMLVEAMKCKQTLDAAHVENLRTLLDQFQKSYMGTAAHEHIKDHHGEATK